MEPGKIRTISPPAPLPAWTEPGAGRRLPAEESVDEDRAVSTRVVE